MMKVVIICLSSFKTGMLIYVFLVCCEIGQLYADLTVNLTSSECGMNYDLDMHKNAQIVHLGSDILQNDRCYLEFSKQSKDHEHYVCISGQEIELDCDTKLEYHASFIKDYLDPDVEMSCGNVTLGEWCPDIYKDTVFVVIRKSPLVTTDVIRLKVYMKDAPDPNRKRTIMLYTIVPIVCIIVLAMTALYVKLKFCKKGQRYSQSTYHTASGTGAVHTGEPNSYQTTQGYQPTPQVDYTGQEGQQYMTGSQGNYTVHPMQSAYPVGGEPAPGSQPLLPGNAPSQDNTADAPPSYESVVGEKH